ncbi:hypothetical protein [Haladaptatus cibarius]|uniref:hypothetical protein n=1 Tax=Haladaptatus cibarius TaxID=453847 RepID=UPI0006796060|nr:hypothetical protein [Haladaptatus cibarius]
MTKRNKDSNRRTFMKRVGAASLGAVTIPATAAADSNSEREYNVARQTGTFDASSSGLSRSERRDFVEKMEQRHGKEATANLVAEPESNFSASADVDGTLVDSVDGHVETNEATSDHIIDIYKTDVYTSSGARRYIYHHWSTASSTSGGLYEGNLVSFTNHVKHTDYSDRKQIKPASSISRNGTDVDLSLTTTAQNKTGTGEVSASASTTVTVLEDTIGYDPNRTSTTTDEYAAQWSGNYEGQQELSGFHVEQRPSYGIREFDYTFELVSDAF